MENHEIEEALCDLPDKVADALRKFKASSVEKDRVYAREYLEFKARSVGLDKVTSEELKAMVRSSDVYYESAMQEVVFESEYVRLSEKLMAAKKQASMRASF